MSIAIYLKTESGDDYLFCIPSLSCKDVVARVVAKMGCELAHVSNVSVKAQKSIPNFLEHDESYERVVFKLLTEEIEKAVNEDD